MAVLGPDATDLSDRIREVHDRLVSEFEQRVSPDVIEKYASESFESLKDSPIADFVPLFVERSTRQRLQEHLSTGGASA